MPAEIPQAAMLISRYITRHLRLPILAPEKAALTPLPSLNASEEKYCLNKDNTPLPRNGGMLEYLVVDNRNIKNRERKYKSSHDAPE